MSFEPTLEKINQEFRAQNLKEEIITHQKLSGTTAGLIYKLESKQGIKYILKYDDPQEIRIVEQFLNLYQNSTLLPQILYTAFDKSYYVYSYIEGTTHFNRGPKINWLTILVKELLNKYSKYQAANMFGRLEFPLSSWREFNLIGIEEARINIGNILSPEDYIFVQSQLNTMYQENELQGESYLLHGDTGVHNFVFNDSAIIAVIDPSPMVGPLIYDFMYAFCSSPDDLDLNTLFTAYDYLEQGHMDRSRLIDEVSIQLYCRVGLCIKHHPNDLPEYLKAWEYWKELCMNKEAGISTGKAAFPS